MTRDAVERMNVLRIADRELSLSEAFRFLANRKQYPIDKLNWSDFSYAPKASVTSGYAGRNLYLLFYVREDSVRAKYSELNSPVCRDSCVEFFFSLDEENYYNFEFNSIGTLLAGYGSLRENRTLLPSERVAGISSVSSMGREPFAERVGKICWQMTVAIPLEAMGISGDVAGQKHRCNFYKCGDELSVPHYLSWNPVVSEKPDFHRPECFGTIVFE